MPRLEQARTSSRSALTRRRLMALAIACGVGPKPALAQSSSGSDSASSGPALPSCNKEFTHAPWRITVIPKPDAPSFHLTYDTGNRTYSFRTPDGPVGLRFVPLRVDGSPPDHPSSPDDVSVDASWTGALESAQSVSGDNPTVTVNYAIVSGGQTLARADRDIGTGSGGVFFVLTDDNNSLMPTLLKSGGTIRAGMSGSDYEWHVEPGPLAEALRLGNQALQAGMLDLAAKRCAAEAPGDGSCFVTTIACGAIGLPDDCRELQAMRLLRERWLRRQPFGAAMLEWYRRSGAQLVQAIPAAARAELARFYLYRLVPAVLAVRLGGDRLAYRWLLGGIERLRRRHAPALPAPPAAR